MQLNWSQPDKEYNSATLEGKTDHEQIICTNVFVKILLEYMTIASMIAEAEFFSSITLTSSLYGNPPPFV